MLQNFSNFCWLHPKQVLLGGGGGAHNKTVVIKSFTLQKKLEGITSFGPDQCGHFPGVYTRVDIYLHFMKQHL